MNQTNTLVEKIHSNTSNSNNYQLKIIFKDDCIGSNISKKHRLESVSNSDSNLKDLFVKTLSEKGEYKMENVEWLDEETVEVKSISKLSINTFILQAEALGKVINYSKQTTIKISNELE